MRSQAIVVALIVAACSVSACRQGNGPVPTQDAGEVRDLTRDLQNLTNNDPNAPTEFADDLRKYAKEPDEQAAIDELSKRTAALMPKVKLTDEAAQKLAQSLWTTVTAREFSERQAETLQEDVQALLMSVGVAEAQAQQVAAQVGDVQRAVNDRPRRWYEVF